MSEHKLRRTICRHCRQSSVNRPRGLCWSCYYKPGIRELYPSTSKYARRGVGNFCGNAPLPVAPTESLPGTAERLVVLAERAARHEALWHPDDALAEPAPDPAINEEVFGYPDDAELPD